jgi:hypothetical protein
MDNKDYWWPTKNNAYTPHVLQKAAMVGMFVLILLSFAATNIQSLFWQASDWLVGAVLPAVVVDLTNEQRLGYQAATLTRNSLLDEAARLKAEHMANNSYFAHYSPDGVSPWYWFEQAGYTYAHAGENLAVHFNDSGAVVDAWMKSPTHKANIVNSNYTEIGVGTAKGKFQGHDTVFVVQLFGAPAAPVVAPALPTVDPRVAVVSTPQVLEEEVDTAPVELAVAEEEPIVAGAEDDLEVVVPVPEDNPRLTYQPALEEVVPVPTDSPKTLVTELVFSSHISASSGLPVANLAGSTATVKEANAAERMATSPSTMLRTIYFSVGMLVMVLLLVSIVLGIYEMQPVRVAYGVLMLLLMSGLFYLHTSLTGQVIIAASFGGSTV